ncbi:MAG: indolepyruvate ferredoxin oxidoreductase subunit beta [Candidatus Methanolliviera hydrocarbonicum]|jgi:indolepyruvate ferredoxin oxidoreductase, beta subunit|uniref:Indolepyruvate ferredoxin oxidoreductase subunit beta n=1 Tax=Candidatus Methanolliviera hydrocarbonicum TaxID=2491085 RepID=A0A520KV66_9EURY|nr:MAG: indolepyruvate ferredoxin oxidoreductase subunit beta [Candidatus Methanolliviera hydrocarbonicum]
MSFDLVIVGVGGQGTILSARIIGEACIIEGRHVISAETHGMAQRGGSVENHVRIDGELGPLVPIGGADMLISLEPLEAIRYGHYLKKDGILISNTVPIVPPTVYRAGILYPDTDSLLLSKFNHAKICNANILATEAGNVLAANIVLIGLASPHLPFEEENLIEGIRRSVPPKTMEINMKAYELGKIHNEETC